MNNKTVTCDLCPRVCPIKEGDLGFCQARTNKEGKILPLNYGRPISMGLDPIEKKPLSYYKPGRLVFSYGTFGCNMTCPFCQNHQIARAGPEDFPGPELKAEDLVKVAESYRGLGNIGLAFTYNEPLIGFEFVYDASLLLKEKCMDSVLVTNGQINDPYLEKILPLISAWNIDLKAFSQEAYKKLGGDLNTTLNTIEKALGHGHVEITSLIVPGINDNPEDFEAQAKYLADLDENIPLHISRYFPNHKYDEPPTSLEVLYGFQEIAKKYLKNVELGNVR